MREAGAAGSDWLWETDPDGVLTWVSDSVEEHTGWPAQPRDRRALAEREPPAAGRHRRESWDRYRAAARRAPALPRRHRRTQTRRTAPMLVAMSGRPRFDADGRFIGYRGAARDVTAGGRRARTRPARPATAAAGDRGVHAGVMISGPDGRVLLSNAGLARQIGRFGDTATHTWESTGARDGPRQGAYPDAIGREEEFIALAAVAGLARRRRRTNCASTTRTCSSATSSCPTAA